jgi:hypothetical protein
MKSITLAISPGRSGTQLLHSLLMKVPGMSGDHENERHPSFSSVRRRNLADPSVGRKYVAESLGYVETLPGEFYSITDLSSSYGAIEHYLDLSVTPNVIILRRDPRLVAASYLTFNLIPYRSPGKWRDWYPSPDEPGALPLADHDRAHDYQYCYWLCCDNERRAQRYLSLLPARGCKVWETSIPQMLDVDHFNGMLEHFDLPKVESVRSGTVDRFADQRVREAPPREFLHPLEIDVLDRIPADFKNNLLNRGWGQP